MNRLRAGVLILLLAIGGLPLAPVCGATAVMPYKATVGTRVPNRHPDLKFIEIPLSVEVEKRDPPGCHEGPCRSMKHGRLTVNPDDGLIYWHGGDFGFDGPPGAEYPAFSNSARQEIFTYDLEHDRWELVLPYCVKDNFTFGHPDQHGWVWDSKRKVFWALPGQQRYFGTACDGTDKQIMAFDPATRAWSLPKPQTPPPLKSEFAIYDEQSDRVYMLGMRNDVLIWNPSSYEWTRVSGGQKPRRKHSVYTAKAGRQIYAIDYMNSELTAFDIGAEHLSSITPLPWMTRECKHGSAHELNYIVYLEHLDAMFIYEWGCYKQAWLYWLSPGAWQEVDIGTADGRHFVYHPGTESLFIMGDSGDLAQNFDNDDATPYVVRMRRIKSD